MWRRSGRIEDRARASPRLHESETPHSKIQICLATVMKTQRFAFCFPQWERALIVERIEKGNFGTEDKEIIANTFFSPHQQSVLQSTTFRPGCPSHFHWERNHYLDKKYCMPKKLSDNQQSTLLGNNEQA